MLLVLGTATQTGLKVFRLSPQTSQGRVRIDPNERYDVAATHGAGCTHSATLAAGLARGLTLEEAAREAARVASAAVRAGLADLGAGDGPVDVLRLQGAA